MSLRAARGLTAAYFVWVAIAVTWPGALPASRVEPVVLGLPFSFFWPALWVALSVPVLWGLDRVEGRHRRGGSAGAPPPPVGEFADGTGAGPWPDGPPAGGSR